MHGRTTLIRGRFEKKVDMWLLYSFCITCIKTLNLNICFGKSDVLTLELYNIVG